MTRSQEEKMPICHGNLTIKQYENMTQDDMVAKVAKICLKLAKVVESCHLVSKTPNEIVCAKKDDNRCYATLYFRQL